MATSTPIVTTNANVVITNVDCNSTVYVGAAVRITSGGVAVNALADTAENSNVIGICESKSSSIKCNIRVLGVSSEIFSGLDVTKTYYLSATTEGLITTSAVTQGSGFIFLPVLKLKSQTFHFLLM